MTNAERIRQMTDEELGDFLYNEGCCPPDVRPCIGGSEGLSCDACWQKWLRQEAEK